jgi:hypothetical protein
MIGLGHAGRKDDSESEVAMKRKIREVRRCDSGAKQA